MTRSAKPPNRLGHVAVTLLKVVVGVSLLSYIFWQASQQDAMTQLVEQPKRWGLLAAAILVTIATAPLGFFRWFLVARAAGTPITYGDACRWGAVGYALQFVGPGALGGDLYKAVLAAKKRPGERTKIVGSVVVDRFLGLFTMLLIACGGIVFVYSQATEFGPAAQFTFNSTLSITAALTLVAVLLLTPGKLSGWLADASERVPLIGKPLGVLAHAWEGYRGARGLLACAFLVSCIVDVMLIVSFHLVALGLPFDAPSLGQHFLIALLQLIAGGLPITPGGVGIRETAAWLLYAEFGFEGNHGAIIAFGHALTMLITGGLSMVYYLIHRGEVQKAMDETPTDDGELESQLEPTGG